MSDTTPSDFLHHPTADPVQERIRTVRGHRVLLDSDLAQLYGVKTKVLNQAVKRNARRFPADFSFVLTAEEALAFEECDELGDHPNLKSQFVTSSSAETEPGTSDSEAPKPHGGRRHLPRVFTEHGAIMAASVLNSTIAVEASVYVVRAFVQFRQALSLKGELSARLSELEERVGKHDHALRDLVAAMRQLMSPTQAPATDPPRERIGFRRLNPPSATLQQAAVG